MWERMQGLIDGSIVVTLDEIKAAVRLMAEKTRVIAEGAGALPLAAALTGKAGRSDRRHCLRGEHRPRQVCRHPERSEGSASFDQLSHRSRLAFTNLVIGQPGIRRHHPVDLPHLAW